MNLYALFYVLKEVNEDAVTKGKSGQTALHLPVLWKIQCINVL